MPRGERDLIAGMCCCVFHLRHGEGVRTRIHHKPTVARELHSKSNQQHRQGEWNDQLGGPRYQLDVDRAVAKLHRSVEVVVRIRDQYTNDEGRYGGADEFDKPERSPRQPLDYEFHSNVSANALNERDGQNSKSDHRDLDDVDVAKDGALENRSQDNLDDAQKHQAKDQRAGDEVEHILKAA